MTLYVDGDAFPNLLKSVLHRAIERLALKTVVVSNKQIYMGDSKHISHIIVDEGPDEADHRIVELVQENDLVITADIPLADRVLSKMAHVIGHRGELFSSDNIKDRLAIRDLMHDIRESGEFGKGPAPFSPKDVHKFINQLDRFLTQQMSR
ncbi:MAG: UPF0178 protein [bacterium]|nr:MAG: UPF0178 protein [bacterium]